MEKVSFENLEVWVLAVEFCELVIKTAENIEYNRNHFRLIEQIESSSASIAANIAEGRDRYSKKEFLHFLYISRGSLFETVSFLCIFRKNYWIKEGQFLDLRQKAIIIGKKISCLIKSIKKS